MPDKVPLDGSLPRIVPVGAKDGSLVPLLNLEDTVRFRTIWKKVQGKFVDERRTTIEQAIVPVFEVVKQLVQVFAHGHTSLDSQWH